MTAGATRPLAGLSEGERESLRRLNNAHARETSHMERDAWNRMTAAAVAALEIGGGAGFVIAFDEGAAYDSPNFLWFRERFARFVYVDRIVVAEEARGRGLARALYGAVFERARAAASPRVVCEVNREPPNPVSDAFHAALGFRALATVALSPEKTVRYLERPL